MTSVLIGELAGVDPSMAGPIINLVVFAALSTLPIVHVFRRKNTDLLSALPPRMTIFSLIFHIIVAIKGTQVFSQYFLEIVYYPDMVREGVFALFIIPICLGHAYSILFHSRKKKSGNLV